MLSIRSLAVCCFTLVSFAASPLLAENWPTWRGPHMNGVSSESNIPTKWSPTQNVAWKTPLPGPAGATPVVWEDHIFLTTVDDRDLLLMCFNTDGEKLWTREVGQGNQTARGDEGNSASPSPVTDGKHVWSFMGTGDLACYDFEGNEIWKFNVQDRYGEFVIQFGMTSTPVVFENQLILMLMHGSMRSADLGYSKLISLDKETGEENWTRDRPSEATYENKHSYASPIIYDDGDTQLLIAHGADYVTAHSLVDGKEIWRCGGLNPANKYDRFLRFVASPAAAEGVVVVPTAKHGPIIGIDVHARGLITGTDSVLWSHEKTTDVPSPLIHDGLVYICLQDGNFYCVESKSGDIVYPLQRTHRMRHRASPVYADGKVYTTARDGKITVIKAGRDFEILAQNDLGEAMSASPVISNGTIYLRTFDHLWAIRSN